MILTPEVHLPAIITAFFFFLFVFARKGYDFYIPVISYDMAIMCGYLCKNKIYDCWAPG
jgi:hypothetical protein